MHTGGAPEPFAERQFLLADIACLPRMLAELPANARITRMGTESRLRAAKARLETLRNTRAPAPTQ